MVLMGVRQLLGEANPADGLLADVTEEFLHQRPAFDARARALTVAHAMGHLVGPVGGAVGMHVTAGEAGEAAAAAPPAAEASAAAPAAREEAQQLQPASGSGRAPLGECGNAPPPPVAAAGRSRLMLKRPLPAAAAGAAAAAGSEPGDKRSRGDDGL
jgi:hypothetical protein